MTTTALIALDVPEFQSLSPSKAEQIRNTFLPMAETLAGFEAAFADVTARATGEITTTVSADARRLRLDIAKIRIAAEKARVEIKAEYVLGGKAIDGANNILKWAIEGKERALEAIENHAARIEAERLEAVGQERTQILAGIGVDAPAGVAAMDPDVWTAYLTTKQRDHADRIEAERVATAARVEAERRRAVALQRTRALATVADFVPADILDDPTMPSDDEFAEIVRVASAAKAARQLELDAERQRAAEAAREVARLEAEQLAQREREEGARRTELARLEEIDRIEREQQAEAARAAREAADAPVKARLRAWITSFALPELPGEPHPAAVEIRRQFESFREHSAQLIDRTGDLA